MNVNKKFNYVCRIDIVLTEPLKPLEIKDLEKDILSKNTLYKEVIGEAEKLLLIKSMKLAKYNQSKCALILGISRGNLRTKLKKYFEEEYFSSFKKYKMTEIENIETLVKEFFNKWEI